MVIMNLHLDNFLIFNDFTLCMSYPKKIVRSSIEDEHLAGRERFRYKKVIVLMGANATGKTAVYFAWVDHFARPNRSPFTGNLTSCHGVLISCIPSASLDSLHLRDVPSIATGTQGYLDFLSLRRSNHCIAHLPPVKAEPLTRWLISWKTRRIPLRKSWDIQCGCAAVQCAFIERYIHHHY